jgi:hypothetical protein
LEYQEVMPLRGGTGSEKRIAARLPPRGAGECYHEAPKLARAALIAALSSDRRKRVGIAAYSSVERSTIAPQPKQAPDKLSLRATGPAK